MKVILTVGVLALALALAACGGSPAAGGPGDQPGASAQPSTGASPAPAGTGSNGGEGSPSAGGTPASAGPAEHDGSRTLSHIKELSVGIGSRVSGTDGEKKATEYIAARFRESGYAVEVSEFEISGFSPTDVVIEGDPKAVDALALAGSGNTGANAPAVFIGLGDAAGIAGRDLSGFVAVAMRGSLRFTEKYENARAAGAAALVIINNQPGLFSGTLGSDSLIPVVGVGNEDEARLRAAAAAGTRVRVSPGAPATALNVIARATPDEACRIVVGGHHDTVPGVPGATDNASGTAHVLELARAFAADGLDPGLCFVTFGGEESGLNGSRALVAEWAAEGALPEYMLNLDVTATGTFVAIIGTPDLQALAKGIADGRGIAAVQTNLPANSGSDHQSFANAGVPVVFLAGDDYSNIHTPRDTIDRASETLVEDIGDIALDVIRQLQVRVARP